MKPTAQDITYWLNVLKTGDREAVQPLWDALFRQLADQARKRAPKTGFNDGEDFALSAFHSCFRAISSGNFNRMDDRHDLWGLMLIKLKQKVCTHARYIGANKRRGTVPLADDSQIPSKEAEAELVTEAADIFDRMLQALPKDDARRVVLLRMEGEKIEDIAKKVGISVRSVMNKLDAARALLEKEINP